MYIFGKSALLIALIVVTGLIAGCAKSAPVVDTQIEPVRIAVESSFLPTAKLLANEFTTNTGIAVEFTNGSNDELVDMILEGGDYDVFMSSDVKHPEVLIKYGKGEGEGTVIYAFGTVALYSKLWKLDWAAPDYLYSGQFNSLAVANPEDNPYGRAGVLMLKNINVYDDTAAKLVYVSDESESLELVETRKADAGFIAYTSLSDREKRWAWIVPPTIYEPIGQAAVLIKKDNVSDSSKIWMGYLSTDSAKSIIRQSGYSVIHNSAAISSN